MTHKDLQSTVDSNEAIKESIAVEKEVTVTESSTTENDPNVESTIVTTTTTTTTTTTESSLAMTRNSSQSSDQAAIVSTGSIQSQLSRSNSQDPMWRSRSDLRIIQTRAELIRNAYNMQRRHTNMADTPLNTTPVAKHDMDLLQSSSSFFSSDRSSFQLLQQQSSLGSLSADQELSENPDPCGFSIDANQSTKTSNEEELDDTANEDEEDFDEPNVPLSASL
ncbi:hypothetical protein RMATCC62417_18112 [Rhizopus microsporus]|nr:hypothetical protein RMATCC62417_18112 [Rhizopus microsporus]